MSIPAIAQPASDAGQMRCKPIEETISQLTKKKEYSAEGMTRLFLAMKQNPKCDDGWYAEGISDLVVKSTAVDFVKVIEKIRSNRDLKFFLKRHIDATADWNDLDKITFNAANSCPEGMKAQCEEIGQVSSAASKEAHEAVNVGK
jgi:hypothetical protein